MQFKNILAVFPVRLILVSFFLANIMCKPKSNDNHSGSHSTANEFMHKQDFEKLLERFENKDRLEWQKPDQVVEKMKISRDMVVGDLGAGSGYFSRRFAQVFKDRKGKGKLIALEPSIQFIEYMQKTMAKDAPFEIKQIDYEGNGISGNTFDLLFLCNVVHHIEKRIDYFKRLKSALRKNGRIVIVDFLKKKLPVGPPVDHKLEKIQIIEEMKKAGYSLHVDENFLPYQYYLEFE